MDKSSYWMNPGNSSSHLCYTGCLLFLGLSEGVQSDTSPLGAGVTHLVKQHPQPKPLLSVLTHLSLHIL